MHHYSSKRSLCSRIQIQLISLGTLHGEGFNFSSEGDLIKVFKDAHVKFQAERIDNIYMLRNLEVIVSGLRLSSASRLEVVEQSETTIVSRSDVRFYPEGRLGLGSAIAKQESPDRYSYGGAKSHKFYVNQGDRWVIKLRSDLNLFDLIKL